MTQNLFGFYLFSFLISRNFLFLLFRQKRKYRNFVKSSKRANRKFSTNKFATGNYSLMSEICFLNVFMRFIPVTMEMNILGRNE